MNWEQLKGVSLDQEAVQDIGKADVSIPFSWYVIGVIVLAVVAFAFVKKAKESSGSGASGDKAGGDKK